MTIVPRIEYIRETEYTKVWNSLVYKQTLIYANDGTTTGQTGHDVLVFTVFSSFIIIIYLFKLVINKRKKSEKRRSKIAVSWLKIALGQKRDKIDLYMSFKTTVLNDKHVCLIAIRSHLSVISITSSSITS